MSSQTTNGLAFEYAIIDQLYGKLIKTNVNSNLINDASFRTAKSKYLLLSSDKQNQLCLAAESAIEKLIKLEPNLQCPGSKDVVSLCIQSCSTGQHGDPRDIVIWKPKQNWEIGISGKNNHRDVKHPRLSPKIDFGKKWVNVPVSDYYWDTAKPLFNQLIQLGQKYKKWDNWKSETGLNDYWKNQEYIIPLLKIFKEELKLLCSDPIVPPKLINYIIGIKDFYQIINLPSQKSIEIIAFNICGTLDKSFQAINSIAKIPFLKLPTSLVSTNISLDEKATTLEAWFDNGWNLTFRLHTADSSIKPSVKFAIGLSSYPKSVYKQNEPC
jgi:HaeIII restriction endonuclease